MARPTADKLNKNFLEREVYLVALEAQQTIDSSAIPVFVDEIRIKCWA